MTFLTTPIVKISRMRKQWIPGPLPSRVGPGDEASGCTVRVDYQGQTGEMLLLIVKGSGPTLLGRDWLSCFRWLPSRGFRLRYM